MTLSEFKAWFEGYTEGLEGAPTAAQFARIKEKVAQISGTPITERVYVDRYVNPWRPYWDRYWAGGTGGWAGTIGTMTGGHGGTIDAGGQVVFDSAKAMYEAGKMEARN